LSEDLSPVDTSNVGSHDDPGEEKVRFGVFMRKCGKDGTHIAIANARSSESRQVRDIQAMLRGCENVPNVCVQTTPKYRTPRMLISVKIRLKTYPSKWRLIPAMTVCPRAFLYNEEVDMMISL
jgi:hypothetical protein